MKLVLLTLFLAHSALVSDFSGIWRGPGTYEESGFGPFQADVEITIEQTQESLNTRDCWKFIAHNINQNLCTNYKFNLIGNDIYLDGVKAGAILKNKIELDFIRESRKIKAQFIIESDKTAKFSYDLTAPDRFTKTTAWDLNLITANQLIEKHIQAIGGRENLLALKTISRIGNIEFFKTSYSPTFGKFKYHTDIVYPTKLREEISGDYTLVDRGTDGNIFWQKANDSYTKITDADYIEQMRKTAERANRDILWIEKEFDTLSVTPNAPDWAQDSLCLLGKKLTTESYICFDKSTGLLTAKGNDQEYRLFANWTKHKNIKIPFHIIHYMNKEKAYEMILNEVHIDEQIDESRFTPPLVAP